MNINKSTIILLFMCSLTVLIITGCSQQQDTSMPEAKSFPTIAVYEYADYQVYSKMEDICEAADIIILGKVNKVPKAEVLDILHPPNGEKMGVVVTVSDVTVEQVFKGDCNPGEVVQVKQMGGRYNNKDYYTEEEEMLDVSMRGFFFLAVYQDIPADPLNPRQGFVKVIDGETYPYDLYEGVYIESSYVPGIPSKAEKPLFSESQSEEEFAELILQNI